MSDQNSILPPPNQEEVAGFASRTMAFMVDLAIIACFLVILFWIAGHGLAHGLTHNLDGILRGSITALFLFMLLPPLFYLAYFSLLHTWSGQTVGKLFMGLRVVTMEGAPPGISRSILRCLASLVSALPLGAGFIWSVLDSRKRTWHDLLAGTEVVITTNLP